MNKKLHITFSCITLIIGVIIAVFGALSFNTVSLIFNNEPYTEWHSGWTRINPDGTTEEIFIPCTVDASPGEPVVIENVIPDTYVPNRSISLRLSMQELKVELDDEVIFNLKHNKDFLTKSVGSSWQVVTFPYGSEGKTVRITLTAPYEMSSGTINSINMGTKCAISFAIFKAHFPRLLIAFFIFLFGALFLILGYVFRTLGSDVARITYLGLFAILVSIWLACESRMLQFFTGNHFIITSLVFIALMLVPLPMMMYLETAYEKHHRNHYPYFIWAFIINFLVCVFLQFTKIADFFETITSTHVLIFVSMAYFVCSALYEVIRYKNSSALANLISVSVLCFFSALELFNFYAGSFAYVTDFFAAGILVYIFMLCFDTYRYVHMLFEKSAEAKHFERLANFDALTNGKNRLSFDNDLALLWKKDIEEETWLCFFDLNDLKMINDTFGHHIGDMALKQTYECISKAFGPDENCYRVGGDEFACVVHGSYDAFKSRLNIFNSEVGLVGKKVAFPFNVATGYVPVDKKKYESIEDMLIDVDMKMYQDKSEKKH
ncbi:MAG: diguanylate cyclase [Clostridia bacterium]|nr:diguanylate cyclase [Clostridia bacterium]